MKTFTIVIIFLLIIAFTALVVWYSLKLEKSSHKTANIIITILGTVLLLVLMYFISRIPKTTDKILTTGIAGITTELDRMSPGSTDTEMDATQFKSYLKDSQEMSDYLLEDKYAGFLTRTFGVRYYIKMFNKFANNLDDNMAMFEQTGQTFSVKNILNYVKDQTVKPVRTATKVLEILATIVSGLFLIIMFYWATSIKKGKISKGVTFGDNVKN